MQHTIWRNDEGQDVAEYAVILGVILAIMFANAGGSID
jgi:Flp pilus assembly pilin Flp